MDPTNTEQTELLRKIWNEVNGLGGRVDGIEKRLDGMDARFDRIDKRLDRVEIRLDGGDARFSTIEDLLRDFAGQQVFLGRFVRNSFERYGGAIAELRRKVDHLEDSVTRDDG